MNKSFLLIITTCLAISAHAQYNFSTFTEIYQPIENGTEIVENDYLWAENIWDDPEFVIDFDFSFPIFNEEYTSLVQEGNGAGLKFSNSDNPTYFSYQSDLIDGELETPFSPSTISYTTQGDVGSRILKIQYDNCAFYNAISGVVAGGDVENRVNFQMWIYENGVFEIRFGLNSITDNQLVHDGPGPVIFLMAPVDQFGESPQYIGILTGDPANPTVVPEIPEDMMLPTLIGNPGNGRVYRFAPNPLSVNEISINNLNLYPTQADQTIFIDGLETPNEKYQIVDITGKVQMNGIINPNEGLDVSKLNAGLYLFQIEGFSDALKFVKL